MFTALNKGRLALGAVAVGAALALAGCASGDPLSSEPQASSSSGSETIVVGSQAYYSNEIIAEIYAQAIENAGLTVERKFQIGQRDAYLPALESGEVDVIPEYTGNLLQFYKPDATETKSDDVYKALASALPTNLAVLEQASATDQDSYNVTAAYAQANGLTSIADLAKVQGVILGGNAELEERPYGPSGLQSVYGVNVTFSATGDTTVDALAAGTVNVANVYTADPRIQSQNLVTLTDPKGLFLASNVVPLVNKDLSSQLADILNPIDAKLTPEGLVELNVESVDQKRSSADIAKDWLQKNGFTS